MATVEQLKKQIAEKELEISNLQPAVDAANVQYKADQAALDAFYARPGKVSLNDLSAAKRAVEANPNDAVAQQTLAQTQSAWTAQQEELRPLLAARDSSFDRVVEAKRPIVELENQAAEAEISIARIDPTQASEDARAALAEREGTQTRENTIPTSEDAEPTSQSSTQVFDDGSTLQTFEDGSTRTVDADGNETFTAAPSNSTAPEDPTNGPVSVLGVPIDDQTGELNPGWAQNPETGEYYYNGNGIDASAQTGAQTADETDGTGGSGNDNRAGVPRGATPPNPAGARAQWSEAKDLRVKLRVPNEYLKGPSAGPASILQKNGGILFPYTPTIAIDNQASYASQNPLHSNYTQYFYKNSSVSPISVTAKFTVQNEFEGAVLLGVIHLLRSLVKMKWGNDPDAGSPPPVCRFDAYGDYMLYNVPVSVASWRHELPDGVDYITVGRPGSPQTYGRSMVPVLSTINLTLNVMYSRREMLEYNTKDWLSGGLRYRGYL